MIRENLLDVADRNRDRSSAILADIRGDFMKLDMSVVREILLWVEEKQVVAYDDIRKIEVAGRTDSEIAYHVSLLNRDGFLDATIQRVGGSTPGEIHLLYSIHSLWMPGHELLDLLREKSHLQRASDLAKQAGRGGLLAVFKSLQDEAVAGIIATAKSMLG